MDSYTWMCQCWLISKDLHQLGVDIVCSLEDLLRKMYDRDGEREKEREGTPSNRHNLMKKYEFNIIYNDIILQLE